MEKLTFNLKKKTFFNMKTMTRDDKTLVMICRN